MVGPRQEILRMKAFCKEQHIYRHRTGLLLKVIKQQWPSTKLSWKLRKEEIIPNLKSRLVKMLATCFWKSYFLSLTSPLKVGHTVQNSNLLAKFLG